MDYFYSILILIGIYVVLASSFNLIIGNAGLVSIAHPIFFALGAYTAGLAAIYFGLHAIVATLAGGVVAALFSLMMSLPSLRVSGDYLMITSIGFQLGLLQVIKNVEFTGSQGGLSNIPTPVTGPYRGLVYSVVSLAVAATVVWIIRWIVRGPYGRAITAMRDDELAFLALGRDAMRIKIVIFAVGCGLAGIAGGLYAFYYQYVSPEQFEILASAAMLTMVVVGGMGSTLGPVVGAVLLIALPQAITFLELPPAIMAPLQGMLFTLLVIVFVFIRPQGLISPEGPTPLPGHRQVNRGGPR
ncbi:MAG: branched-chain amino acid ABC transporter permease [Betaproteobacteria bacterium]